MAQEQGPLVGGLPERHFGRDDRFTLVDDDGFLRESESLGLLSIQKLLSHWCSLTLAPSWMGKTFVAKALEKALLTGWPGSSTTDAKFGHVQLTCFERPDAHRELPPSWWETWRHSDNRACWIVDAIDEGQHRQPGTADRIVDILEQLDDHERGRLTVVLFSRQRGIPQGLPSRLQAMTVYSTSFGYREFLMVQFGPLTRGEAERIVGGRGNLRRVLSMIRNHQLQALTRYPRVLEYLARQRMDAQVSEKSVWNGILLDLLQEHNVNRFKMPTTQPEDQLQSAAHIAAVLTLTGNEEFSCEGLNQSGLCLSEIIPHPGMLGTPLRTAAIEALDSDLFQRTATGYRFAQNNIQEKLAAFGLSRLRLSALKPVVADSAGKPLYDLVEMLNFLKTTTDHPDVRKWVVSVVSLLRSEAPRLSRLEARHAIRRLLEIAKETPWYLYEVDLSRLAAPGIGKEIHRWLRNHSRLRPAAIRLLLDIASETGAREVVPLACRIAMDSRAPMPVRHSAVRVAMRCGTADEMRQLARLALRPGSRAERKNLSAAVIMGLLNAKLWTLPEAACVVPATTPHVVDSAAMLVDHIKKHATPRDAREIIRFFLDVSEGAILEPRVAPLSLKEPRTELLSAMIDTLLQQGQLDDSDLDVLAWAVVSVSFFDLPNGLGGTLVRKLSEQEPLRREAYLLGAKGAASKATGRADARRDFVWMDVLQYQDIDWLCEIAGTFDPTPDFLLRDLLRLAYYRSEGQPDAKARARRIGRLVREKAPGLWKQFTTTRRAYARQEREATARRQQAEKKVPRYPIGEFVNQLLGRKDLSVQQKLWQLSWICFVEPPSRPNNIDGQWSGLDEATRKVVLDTCQEALRTCKPTDIPAGSSYPIAVRYEGSAFQALLKYRSDFSWLTPDLVTKWLRTAIWALPNDVAWICDKCAKVSREATEEVALQLLDREMAAENPCLYITSSLPVSLWTDTFVAGIVKRIVDPHAAGTARAALLRLLVSRSPQHALPIARKWASQYSWSDGAGRVMVTAAFDVLLVASPAEGWRVVKQTHTTHGKAVLLALDSICEGYDESCRMKDWPSNVLAELGVVLYREFPVQPDEHRAGAHVVGREDELRGTRDLIPNILLNRGGTEDPALRQLADAEPAIARWLRHLKAEHKASAVVAGATQASLPSLRDVLRILEDADYRLIRSPDDLLTVLVEALRERVAVNAGHHVEMLYISAKKHLDETALQAYVACRLTDLLPGKVLHRETKINRRKRTDIQVESPAFDHSLPSVIIEVKWSDNPTMQSGLAEQLGRGYLLDEGKTHGIYLVGWCGTVRWKGMKERTREGLEMALRTQARSFCNRHKGRRILPVVLALEWSTR